METEEETSDFIIFSQLGHTWPESLLKSVVTLRGYVMRVLTSFTTDAL